MKPHDGGGWKSVYKVNDQQDLFNKHAETGQLVMMLQEEIDFTEYFRCYVLGGKNVHIMQYEPRNPHHLRYVRDGAPVAQKILDQVRKYCIDLNQALGYDFNTVEFAIRDGIPYAIDFCNPAPDADVNSVGQENFDWIVENAAMMAIEKAKEFKPGKVNLTWGSFIGNQFPTVAPKKPVAKKAAPVRKTTTAKKATATKAAPKATSPRAKKVAAPATATTSVTKAAPKAPATRTKKAATSASTSKTVAKKATPAKKTTTAASAKKAPAAKAATKPAVRKTAAKKTTTRATKK
jgi:hypothetical protein